MKPLRSRLILLSLLLCISASGQVTPPALIVDQGESDGAKPPEILPITSVKVQTRILGCIAETAMTLVFSNPQDRALAGDLVKDRKDRGQTYK
jgi:hypothetical protein